ncbi:hypothetical protein MRY87_03235, partial [bacterium]|nr:hypothetical protein [bacterium]
ASLPEGGVTMDPDTGVTPPDHQKSKRPLVIGLASTVTALGVLTFGAQCSEHRRRASPPKLAPVSRPEPEKSPAALAIQDAIQADMVVAQVARANLEAGLSDPDEGFVDVVLDTISEAGSQVYRSVHAATGWLLEKF